MASQNHPEQRIEGSRTVNRASDLRATPVSVKAVLKCGDRWVLLRNERDEWELPGGQIDPDDASLQAVVERECFEELGLVVQVGDLVDSWLFEVIPGRSVVIVCFAALMAEGAEPVISDEHNAVGIFATSELDGLNLPVGYRRAIDRVLAR